MPSRAAPQRIGHMDSPYAEISAGIGAAGPADFDTHGLRLSLGSRRPVYGGGGEKAPPERPAGGARCPYSQPKQHPALSKARRGAGPAGAHSWRPSDMLRCVSAVLDSCSGMWGPGTLASAARCACSNRLGALPACRACARSPRRSSRRLRRDPVAAGRQLLRANRLCLPQAGEPLQRKLALLPLRLAVGLPRLLALPPRPAPPRLC